MVVPGHLYGGGPADLRDCIPGTGAGADCRPGVSGECGISQGAGEEWLLAGGNENRGCCEGWEGDRCEGVSPGFPRLFHNQFVACSADIDDADVGVFGEGAAEAGDEDLEAAGVEEVIVAPEVQEEVLHRDHFSFGPTEAAEDFGLAMGKVRGFALR